MERFLVTGANGYIGSMIIRELFEQAKKQNKEIEITGLVRNLQYINPKLPNETLVKEVDITDQAKMKCIEGEYDYIIHCAASTNSTVMKTNPIEVADGLVLGTRNVLELAKRLNIKSMVYLSSMEVYGRVKDNGRLRSEDDLGDIDLCKVRSCYPLGKRMAEHYCLLFCKEHGVPVKVARLAQIFGKGVKEEDNRVYMQFARAVLEKRNIVLQTEGNSYGNYCSIDDALRGIFLILYAGENGEVYNVVNEENTMTIREMAEFVTENIGEGHIKVEYESNSDVAAQYAVDTELRMSAEKLRKLGWKPSKDLAGMYEDLIVELGGL